MTIELSQIAALLQKFLADESTFAASEALYCETFKDEQTFTVADDCYSVGELLAFLMSPIYAPSAPCCDDSDEYGYEPEILKERLSLEDAKSILPHVEFVELCNYKGEGEGFTLAVRAAGLRTFKSKYEYK